MDELLISIVSVLALGGGIGYFIGYLIKKLSHLALTIGIFAFLLMYMVYRNAIVLNLGELVVTVTKFAGVLGPLGFATLATSAPFLGSFFVGLVLGLRERF